MLKDKIFEKNFDKNSLTENEKIALAYECLYQNEINELQEKGLLEDLENDKDFYRHFKNFVIALLTDLEQKYISIKSLLED